MRKYFVYIVGSIAGALYVGVTNDLERRMFEHKNGLTPGFTSKYRIHKLLYVEETSDIRSALAREKEIKGWRRSKKTDLIRMLNPTWTDLASQIPRVARDDKRTAKAGL